jgi:hypothetical protein
MIPVGPGELRRAGLNARSVLSIAIAAGCFVADSTVLAQNVPNQSDLRAQFGSGLGQQALPPGLTFEPRLEFAAQYASNINLASSGGDDAFGLELAPGAYAAYNSDRFTGAADYSLIGRLWDDGSLDDITNALIANGRWTAVPELLFVNGAASYRDVVIDQAQGGNFGNLGVFNSGNIAEQATASVSPSLQKRLNDLQFEASYSYGRVWYLDDGSDQSSAPITRFATQDSENQQARVSLGLVPDARKYAGRVFYSWDRSDFEDSIPYQFERAGFDGSLELSRTLSMVGDVGRESALDVNTSDGGLDSDFWSAGLRWSNSTRSSAELRYGERFFGTSYEARISHTARMLEFSASYVEAPAVETYQYNLNAFEPGELPPGFDPDDLAQFNGQPFVGTNARVGVRAKGARTTIGVSAYDTDQDFLNPLVGDEQVTGVAVNATRVLAANADLEFVASYNDRQRGETTAIPGQVLVATRFYQTDLTFRANRAFGPRLTGSLEAGYFNNSGSNDNDGWWLGLRGRWLPAFGR